MEVGAIHASRLDGRQAEVAADIDGESAGGARRPSQSARVDRHRVDRDLVARCVLEDVADRRGQRQHDRLERRRKAVETSRGRRARKHRDAARRAARTTRTRGDGHGARVDAVGRDDAEVEVALVDQRVLLKHDAASRCQRVVRRKRLGKGRRRNTDRSGKRREPNKIAHLDSPL